MTAGDCLGPLGGGRYNPLTCRIITANIKLNFELSKLLLNIFIEISRFCPEFASFPTIFRPLRASKRPLGRVRLTIRATA